MPDDDEETRVQAWRLLRLSQLGYTQPLLDLIAESDVDLHETEQLLAAGCPLEVAAQIVL